MTNIKISNQVFLSRRNLLTLLSKLDRAAAGELTFKTLIKNKDKSEKYQQTMDSISVTAVEDDEYYSALDRRPGEVVPEDDPTTKTTGDNHVD